MSKPAPPSRAGTRPLTVHFPKPVRDQLKVLAAEQGRTMQSLVAEGLNAVFSRYGKSAVAPEREGEGA